jgi:predicted nucleic acid-binding protein
MNGNNAVVIDTNALIYFFNGNKKVSDSIEGETLYISSISEIELLSFSKLDAESESQIRLFLEDDHCRLIELIPAIKELTIRIRKKHRLKLPDAIIAATAIFLGIPLLTFDSDFAKIDEIDLILLEL